jgi:hypothetical protein
MYGGCWKMKIKFIFLLLLSIIFIELTSGLWYYQENADSYVCDANFNVSYPCTNCYDGNWTTGGKSNVGIEAVYFANYTKPINANSSSIWIRKSNPSYTNSSIFPNNCWIQSIIQIKRVEHQTYPEVDDYCWDGTTWQNIGAYQFYLNTLIYEDAMNWSIYSFSPIINIISPTSYQSFNYKENIQFNVTEADNDTLSMCWYSNSSGAINYTYTCGANFTINESTSGNYSVTIWANDTYNQLSSSTVSYVVALDSPAVTINYPTEELGINYNNFIDLNVTVLDSNDIRNCSLWTNSTGSWSLNLTNNSDISSGTKYKFSQNFTDGYYKFNFYCYNNNSVLGFAGSNFSFFVDTIEPTSSITSITTTDGSQTISFNSTATDTNLYSCKYSIYNSTGGIDGLNSNVSMSCNTQNSATTTAYGIFTLRVYSADIASNENYTEFNFTTAPSEGGGGGGGARTIFITTEWNTEVCRGLDITFKENWDTFTDDITWVNFKLMWFSLWNHSFCVSSASIIPLAYETNVTSE